MVMLIYVKERNNGKTKAKQSKRNKHDGLGQTGSGDTRRIGAAGVEAGFGWQASEEVSDQWIL